MSVFIGLITGPGELANITALVEQAHHFDGLAVTYHGSKEDLEYIVLDKNKGAGFVECIPYFGHHSHSMNHFLYNPIIKLGDWILLRDSAERVAGSFAAQIKNFVQNMEDQKVSTIYQYSKLLLFKRAPYQSFHGTPHWGFQGGQPSAISIETTDWFKSDKEYCYSARDQREDFHWVSAYLRYYLLNDSNHLMLGKEIPQKAGVTFEMRETWRRMFLGYLRSVLPEHPSVSNLKKFWLENSLTKDMKTFIDNEKILSDAYRYFILNDLTVVHSHEWSDIIPIDKVLNKS